MPNREHWKVPSEGAVQVTTHKVFILEDHPLMRRMLRLLVEEELRLEVVGEASSAETALAMPELEGADLVLVDLSLPGMSGLEFIRTLKNRAPDMRCLVVSAHTERYYLEAALEAGARGYVSKDEPERLPEAIRRVL